MMHGATMKFILGFVKPLKCIIRKCGCRELRWGILTQKLLALRETILESQI